MRAAFWLLALFGVAAAVALFVGDNPGTVTLFWPPYRVDLSLNLVLVALLGVFLFLHAALRALAALFDLPRQALRWRNQQKERAMHGAFLDALSHLLAGRFIRARKSAEAALAQEQSLAAAGDRLPHGAQLRTLAHLLAAESAHSLQDRGARDAHLNQSLEQGGGSREAHETREGALMRAARWSLDDQEPRAAMDWLKGLPLGAARRTLALRMKLRASRLARQSDDALDTARLLAKHHAFSPEAAQGIVRGLAIDLLNQAYDVAQLQRAWASLESSEREMPEVATHAAQRLVRLGGEAQQARDWLLPVWERYRTLPGSAKVRLVQALQQGMQDLDAPWLARIESAQRADPRDGLLQYLAGMACMHRQLWGKAQQLLSQATLSVQDAPLHRDAWRALAQLAEQRGDEDAAALAWRRAAGE